MSHFYDGSGKPVYEVERTDGKGLRPTTLRDARKLNLVPSVTTITGQLAKLGLVNWQMEQAVYATLACPRQKQEEEYESYIKRIVYAANNISRAASERGNSLHNKLEDYFKSKHLDLNDEDVNFINPVIQEVYKLVSTRELLKSEVSFSHVLGFGGKIDLISPGFIIDFKTKTTTDKKKFYKYDEHMMQLAAYREGVNQPTARCVDIYFSSVEPAIVEVHEWSEEDLKRGWDMFKALLSYWKLSNKYG